MPTIQESKDLVQSRIKGKRKGMETTKKTIIKQDDGSVYTGFIIDGKKSGTWKLTYSDGTIEQGLYDRDKRIGQRITIFPDGVERIGKYDENGNGQWIVPYAKNILDGFDNTKGIMISVPPHGTKRMNEFKNSKKIGRWEEKSTSSEERCGNYIDGKKDGTRCGDSPYGDYIFEEYKNDELLSSVFKVKGKSIGDYDYRSVKLVKSKIKGIRKGSTVPNYIHSIRVYSDLNRYLFDEDTQTAGLLHDIIEDGGMTLEELKELGYSDIILHLVDLATHDVLVEGSFERWQKMLERLIKEDNKSAWAIKLADISDNLLECHLMPNKEKLDRFLNKKCPVFIYYGNKHFAGTKFYNEFLERYFKQMKAFNQYFV